MGNTLQKTVHRIITRAIQQMQAEVRLAIESGGSVELQVPWRAEFVLFVPIPVDEDIVVRPRSFSAVTDQLHPDGKLTLLYIAGSRIYFSDQIAFDMQSLREAAADEGHFETTKLKSPIPAFLVGSGAEGIGFDRAQGPTGVDAPEGKRRHFLPTAAEPDRRRADSRGAHLTDTPRDLTPDLEL